MVDSAAGDVAPKSTVSVEMTLSLAMSPVTSAVEARQSPKPSGANTGAMMLPRPASRLCDWSATTLKRISNVCRNQMTTVAAKIMVKALVMKSLALSHASITVVLTLGRR